MSAVLATLLAAIVLVAYALLLLVGAYLVVVAIYWQITDDPAAPIGTVREEHQ